MAQSSIEVTFESPTTPYANEPYFAVAENLRINRIATKAI
jgi:hypothetical protein